MNRVEHFVIPADDIDRAQRFYHALFGWEFKSGPEIGANYVRAITVPEDESGEPQAPGAINGGMMQREALRQNYPSVVISVLDIQEYMNRVPAEGGEVILGRTPVGEVGHFAQVADTEGNVIGLWEDAKK